MRDLGPALGGVPVPSGSVGTAPPPSETAGLATVAIRPADLERLAGWRARLRQTAGIGAGRTIALTGARLRIGRATGSDITIDDGSISRTHAEIRFENRCWLVEDLRSANGVRIDGSPVQTAPLAPGCTLTLGNVQLVLEQPVPEVPLPERLSLLAGSELLANLDEHARHEIAIGLEGRFFPEGAVIARADAPGEVMLFVVAGSVRVVEVNDEGGEQVIEHLGPGGWFGDRLLVAGGAYGHTLVADTDVCVLELAKSKLQMLRHTRPEVDQTIVLNARERLRTAQSKAPDRVQRHDGVEHFAVATAVEIIGEDLEIRQARTQVEEAARAGAHLLIIGERGVGKKTFARYYHHISTGARQPYVEISLAEVAPAAVEATLFGVEADPANPQEEGQTGLLETIGDGTLAIVHAERLDIHQQRLLLTYLTHGWYWRQHGRQAHQGQTRLVLVATGSEAEVMGRLIPDLWEALAGRRVVVPPLTQRLRDIPLLAKHFLGLDAKQSGRRARLLSREAEDRLVSYGWPGNLRELENVMQRAAIVASEDTIVAPDLIFVAPPEKEVHKLNLLRNEKLRTFLRRSRLLTVLTWVNIALVGLVTALTLYGATRPPGHPLREAGSNPGMLVTWSIWAVFLPLVSVLVGRIWCGICPIAGIGEFVAGLKRYNLPAPSFLKRIDFWGLVIAFVVVDLIESFVEIDVSPLSTGIFLLVVLYLAIAFTVLFERRAFCRYLCPLAGWLGAYSTIAPIEIRGNKKVCQTQCGEHTCYTGTETVEGCPMFLYPASMTSNAECLLCTKCVQACAHKGVQLNLRPPLSELWRNSQPLLALSVFSVMLVGIMGFHQLEGLAWFKPLKTGFFASSAVANPVLMGSFIILCLLGFALAATLSAAASQERVRDNLAAYGIGFVPLAFAGHAAHLLEGFLDHGLYELLGYARKLWDSVINGMPMTGREGLVEPFVNPAVITFLKFLVVSGGITGSAVALVMIARRAGERNAFARALPHLLLLAGLAITYYVIFLGTQS